MIYAWEHPESIHRSVMIAVNPPGHFLWDGPTIDEQIARYAKLCSQDESCSTRTGDLAATMKQTAADIPDRWFFLPIKDGNVRVASFFGLMETTSESAPLSAPMTLGSWLAAADGDASGFWFQSLLADLAFPEAFVWGQMAAVAGSTRGRDEHLLFRQPEARIEPGRRDDGVDLGAAAGWSIPGPRRWPRTTTARSARRTSRPF